MALLAGAVALTGCAKEAEASQAEPAPGSPVSLDFTFSSYSRLGIDDAGVVSWEPGDKIGVFAIKHNGSGTAGVNWTTDNIHVRNAAFEYTGTGFEGDLIFYPMDDSRLDFYAYYPYDAAYDSSLELTFDARTAQQPLMLASFASATRVSTAPLNFTQELAMVEVRYPGFTGTITLENVTAVAQSFDWGNQSAGTTYTSDGAPYSVPMQAVAGSDGVYRAWIPGVSQNNYTPGTRLLTLSNGTQSSPYNAEAPIVMGKGKAFIVTP